MENDPNIIPDAEEAKKAREREIRLKSRRTTYRGLDVLVEKLQDYEGMEKTRARKAVKALFEIMKKAIKEGKDVEIEGLGTLTIVKRKDGRILRRGLFVYNKDGTRSSTGTSIMNYTKSIYSVKLKLLPKVIKDGV